MSCKIKGCVFFGKVLLVKIKIRLSLRSSQKRKFEGEIVEKSENIAQFNGSVVQLVRMLPCHGRGRGFESRPVRFSRISAIEILFYFYLILLLIG